MKVLDMDDMYIEYEDRVESGEIDPQEISAADYVADKIAEAVDRAMDEADAQRDEKESV